MLVRAGERIRLDELDGLRGWASLSVALYHICWETFGDAFPAIHNIILGMMLNGRLAVSIFFVLSGEVLSVAYWGNRDRAGVARMAIRRYSRLTIPIFFSCLAVYLLMCFGWVHFEAARPIVNNPIMFDQILAFSPDFAGLMRYSLFDVYIVRKAQQGVVTYNNFLWTMPTELIGSFCVFFVLMTERYIKHALAVVLVAGIALVVARSLVGCFMFGIVLGHMHIKGTFAILRSKRGVPVFSVLAAAGLLVWVSWLQMRGQNQTGSFTLAAAAVVFCVHVNTGLAGFFRNRVSVVLGRLSFPLYLVHFPVILSLTAFGIVWARDHGGLTPVAAAGIMVVSILARLLCAVAFEPVEWLTRVFGVGLTRLLPMPLIPARVDIDSPAAPQRRHADGGRHPRLSSVRQEKGVGADLRRHDG